MFIFKNLKSLRCLSNYQTSVMKISKAPRLIIFSVAIFTACQKSDIEQVRISAIDDNAAAATFKIPTPAHVVVLILENHAYEQIIGSSSAPI